jgi:uncharacterized membrane protein
MRTERLSRNALVGMRTNATMASDAAWKASHRASAWSVALAGVVLLGAGLWLVTGGQPASGDRTLRNGTLLAVLVVVVVGGFHADRVAKDLSGEGVHDDRPASSETSARQHRVASELVAAIALALLGLAAWPFAPQELPMHWGFEGFGNLNPSWVALILWPWSCAAVAAYVTLLPRYRERPTSRQCARLMLVLSVTDLLMQLTYVAL